MNKPHFVVSSRSGNRCHIRPVDRAQMSEISSDNSDRRLDAQDNAPQVPSTDELRAMMHRQAGQPSQLLDEIRRKVQNGDYLTRAAAEESAKRMLDDGDI